jgi:hypothetical protein
MLWLEVDCLQGTHSGADVQVSVSRPSENSTSCTVLLRHENTV